MNTKAKESTTKEIPLLIRSVQWTVAERTENQVSAVCYKSKQDNMIMQLNQKIKQQNQMMKQQNKKIDDLNDLLCLQKDINAELRNRIEILEGIEQNGNTGKTIRRKSIPNNAVKSPSSGSRTNILMADSKEDPDATVFGSKIKRSEVSAIYTKNTLEHVPSSAWDVSDSKDGSVMAWTSMDSDGNTFILYLAADGDIYANPNSSDLFANYTNLTSADFTYLKMDLVTNTNGMFNNCTNLKQLDVSRWDVSNVADMGLMFFQCKQLQTLDVSHWDVSNVTIMESMFYSCEQLQTLDVSHWDVSNVTDMWDMFSRCTQLQTLDVSHWDVSNVINMMYMFNNSPYIDQLEKGALSSWKLNPDVYMEKIFVGTKFQDNPMDLFRIENHEETASKPDTHNAIIKKSSTASKYAILMADPSKLFSLTGSTVLGSKLKRRQISTIYTRNTLENIPSSAWDVSAARDGSVMAWTSISSDNNMYVLYLAADGYIYANPNCKYMFAEYKNLTDADFTYLKTDKVNDMSSMFMNCRQLQSLNVSHWNVSNVTIMESMFWDCTQLQTLDVSYWDVSNVTNMHHMFSYCNQLQVLDVSLWNVSNVTNMHHMFSYCNQLQVLDVSLWNVSNVIDMHDMFCGCKQLQTLDISQWDVSNVNNMNNMFYNCLCINQLTEGSLSSWNLNPVVTMEHFCKGTKFGNNHMDLFQKNNQE